MLTYFISAKAEEAVSHHQYNRWLSGGDPASAKQLELEPEPEPELELEPEPELEHSATCSFNSCVKQSHKDSVQRTVTAGE